MIKQGGISHIITQLMFDIMHNAIILKYKFKIKLYNVNINFITYSNSQLK